MAMPTAAAPQLPWWKEPTKDQWLAWIAAWLGWTLDAFDFTIFLLIMVPIAWAGFTGPVLAILAANQPLGFAMPMMISTSGAAVVFILALLIGPETKGKVLMAELTVAAGD